ncbi:unnamed protein product, partial [Closterium sp. Naga37s-1]
AQDLDVVDLLPGPIWHIIFRLLLLPPATSSQLKKRGESSQEASSRGASSSLRNFVDEICGNKPACTQQVAREEHEKGIRRFGSSWPVLRCAMASKRLLYHVASFS